MAEVRLEAVDKRFGPVTALKDLSIAAADGELLVLVGPSGCGKSTTLRIVAGLDEPNSGQVWIGGRPVSGLSPRQRDVAFVFQGYALYPHLSVEENLGFPLRVRRVPRGEHASQVRRAAELLGISDLLQRKPRELSGGQRQRVALGRAIVRQPAAFLMDEPLSNLDAKLRSDMRAEIRSLQRRLGTTTLYVTHDQVEAMSMGDRVVVLRDGVLQQVGTPQQLYDEPANRFVAGFIGSPPMNLLPAEILREGSRTTLILAGERLVLPPELTWSQPGMVVGEVVLGIRPDALTVPPHAEVRGPHLTVRCSVEDVEYLGAHYLIRCRLGAHSLVALPNLAVPVCPGDALPLALPLGSAHLFHPDSGIRINLK
ncbi:MAG TPA: ABC transporter ATP-binding protein [Deferrisomatales bacterium]|nr:ABC transporter ATP-binding protein [Deferrisomatales bacterium]